MTKGTPELSFDRTPEGVAFWIHVTPRARRPGVGGLRGDALRVGVEAAPVAGAANAACVRELARALGLRRRAVDLDAGSRSRRKRVRVAGDPADLAARLLDLAAGEAGR